MKKLLTVAVASVLLAACSERTRRFIGYRLTGKAPAVLCRSDGSARWCLHEPADARPDDVIYFLHYATGDEKSWDRLGLARAFYDEYRRLGRPAPRAITVSYGSHWLLTRRPGIRQTVPLEDFDALRRNIEERLGGVKRRYLWGMSQGGYNAAVLVLSNPTAWSGAALSCPAMFDSSPYAPPHDKRFGREAEGRQLFTYRMAGESAWLEDNPLALAAASPSVPPMWIEANRDDEFGFASGARALAKATHAQLVDSPGGHCVIDARAAARFLANLEPRL